MSTTLIRRNFLSKTCQFNRFHRLQLSKFSTKIDEILDVESLYIQPQVQELLLKITGFDIKKIFASNYVKEIESPEYKLLTDIQLKELETDAKLRAKEKLRMPPFKKMWNTKLPVIENNEKLANFELTNSKYVFVDISPNTLYNERCVSIRETNGTLRLAENEEKDRLVHMFLPRPGKFYYMPKMFEETQLEKVLSEKRYKYVLDRACVQFEPDDPNYIRTTQRTYEHISLTNNFEQLRSTRHFGPMAFYFLIHKNVDALLKDMLSRELFDDAVHLIQLYHIIHPKSKSANLIKKNKLTVNEDIIKAFIEKDVKNRLDFEFFDQLVNTKNTPRKEISL